MTVQMVNTVSVTFTYSNCQSNGTASESFESFLKTDDSKGSEVQKSESQVPISDKTMVKPAEDKEVVSENTAKTEKSESVFCDQDAVKNDTDTSVIDQEIAVEELPEAKQLSEDILAEILSVLNEFVSVLQNELKISETELSDAAADIQFGLADFFDATQMKELFLHVNHVEESELITDENLYKSLKVLQNTFSEVLENSELYQLLQHEGFEPEQFEVSDYESQISEFIFEKGTSGVLEETVVTVDVTETIETAEKIETVIEFDNEQFKSEHSGTEMVQLSETEDESNRVAVIAEKDGGSDSDMMKQSYESERGRAQANLFLQKLVGSVKETVTESVQNASADFELYDIAAQIIEQVKVQIRPENTKMEIRLNPEHLGKVELEVSSKNGELSARINVQNDQVKEAVESQMQVLRDTLEAQGLKVENVEVTVAEFGFRFQDGQGSAEQFQQEQHRRNSFQFDETDNTEYDVSDVSEVMKELNGNSVDYVA